MLDAEKLFEMFANQQAINESNIGIPLSKHDHRVMQTKDKSDNGLQMVIRSARGGAGVAMNQAFHACSIKVQALSTRSKKYDRKIVVPTKSYDSLKSNDIAIVDMIEFYADHDLSSDIRNVVRSFVYDNQMAIIAFWFTPNNEGDQIGLVLKQYMVDQLANKKYVDNPISKWKSQKELDADKEKLNEYVQQKLDNDSIQLNFGN